MRRTAARWKAAIGTHTPVASTMLTAQQKAQCVLWYAEFKSIVRVQRQFRVTYRGHKAPDDKAIRCWCNQFRDTGSVLKGHSPGRPRTSEDKVEEIRQSCIRSPKKSIARRSLQLNIPKSTLHDVIRRRLRLRAYKIQLRHQIKPADRPTRTDFASFMLNAIDDNPTLLKRVLFSDKATFHINGVVNRHNCRIWGSEQPNIVHEHVRDSPKVNVWCGLMHDRVIGPFFFAEQTINGIIYLDMLEQFLFPQIEEIEEQVGE